MLYDFLAGFNPSAIEITIFALLLAAFIGGLVWYAMVTRRRRRKRRIAASRRRYAELLEELALSRSDQGTLELLRDELEDEDQQHLLLTNHAIFNVCAERARQAGTVGTGEISALRVRLGFAGKPVGREPESSAEIRPGSGVLVVDAHDRVYSGRVGEPAPDRFRVRLDSAKEAPPTQSVVDVVYQNGSGIYRFHSVVLTREGAEIGLEHSEELDRVQRRRYYRAELRLPVFVRPGGSREEPQRTELVDIGGGGASFYAPDERYEPGETVELTFNASSTDALHLPARIVRESHGGSVVHVAFQGISQNTRDRIVGFLFRRAP